MAAVLMIGATTPSFNLVVVFVVVIVVIAVVAAVLAVVGEDGFGWSTSRPRSAAAGP